MGPSPSPEAAIASKATTMKAITQSEYGDSSVLTYGDLAVPTIKADQVLVAVTAAGIDRGTEHLMTGLPLLVRLAGFGVVRPKHPVPGLDVAGVVSAVGDDVTRFSVGDEVFGVANGSFAEYAAADEDKLAMKPSSITFEEAAASSISGVTALQALTDVGRLESGQRVLVIGASGGVGSFAVQLARAFGGVVDGVASSSKHEFVTSLGAEHVYDYRTTDIADIKQRYDLLLDLGGRNPVRKLRGLLTRRGTLVLIGGEGGNRITGGFGRGMRAAALSPFVGHRLAMLISKDHYSFMERLAEHLDTGDVRPSIGARFPLDRGIDAMRHLESGEAQGKVVITI